MAGLADLSPETKAALDNAQFIVEIDAKRHPDWVELPDGTRYVAEKTTTASVEWPDGDVAYFMCNNCFTTRDAAFRFCPKCGARVINYDKALDEWVGLYA